MHSEEIEVCFRRVEIAQVDEMWSYVLGKYQQRWLWHAIDARTGVILAYVLGSRETEAFLELRRLLAPFRIRYYHTDDLNIYHQNIPRNQLETGKDKTQRIERKHLTLRTRIKRLTRKTICFSKNILMHDIVIGLYINHYEFGTPLHFFLLNSLPCNA